MPFFVIWVDREHARLFEFSNEKMVREHLDAHHTDHHTHRFDAIDHQLQEKAFFSEISARLSDAEQILILGPGVAKHHFQNHLVEQFPALARKVIGCETVDHPTDPQIAALARKYIA